jgi:hypothetical protein
MTGVDIQMPILVLIIRTTMVLSFAKTNVCPLESATRQGTID